MAIVGNNYLEITIYNHKKMSFNNLNCLQVFEVLNDYLGDMICFKLNNKIFNQPKVEIKDDDLILDNIDYPENDKYEFLSKLFEGSYK